MTKTERYINDDGIEMCSDLFINDETGEVTGRCDYPYISPEEEARIQAKMQAQMEAEEHQRQLEAQKAQMQGTILTQLLLNQAQLMAKLKESGVIE